MKGVSNDTNAEMATAALQKILLLQQGKGRCWAFQLPGTHDELLGKARVLGQTQLEILLGEFVLL